MPRSVESYRVGKCNFPLRINFFWYRFSIKIHFSIILPRKSRPILWKTEEGNERSTTPSSNGPNVSTSILGHFRPRVMSAIGLREFGGSGETTRCRKLDIPRGQIFGNFSKDFGCFHEPKIAQIRAKIGSSHRKLTGEECRGQSGTIRSENYDFRSR